MSDQTLELLRVIRLRLAQTVRRISLADAAFGLLVSAAVAALLWLIAAALESQLWLSSGPRAVLLLVVLGGILAVFGYFTARPLLRVARLLPPYPDTLVAQRIGSRYPEVGDRLRNMLDLSEGRYSEAPPAMVDGAVSMLGRQILPVPFEQVEDFGRARRAVRFAAAPIALLVLFSIIAPGKFFGASQRLVSVGTEFKRPAPFSLDVEPGDAEIIRGSSLQTTILSSGNRPPASVTLAINYADEEHVERITLSPDSVGRFRHAIESVRRPMRYRIETEPVTTRWYQVAVLERPALRGLQVTLHYPNYAGLATRRLEPNVGDVTALAGTRVGVEVGLGSQQLEEAMLVFEDGTEERLERDGNLGRANFTLRAKGSYHVVLRAAGGIENAEPVVYQLDVVPDEAPTIVLTSPDPSMNLDRTLAVPVGARIRDDYGFHDLELRYRLAESRYKTPSDSFVAVQVPLDDRKALDQIVAYPWLLAETTSLDPVPGDVIEYYLQVRDNDAWSGFKAATSERYRLVVPSLAERYQALEEEQESAEREIEQILEEAENVSAEFEALRNELRRTQEGSWDNQRQLEQIESRQAEVERRVDQLGERLDDMTREMRTNDLVSNETVELYDELRKVVDEINSPELREALERLQNAVENLDLEQLQQSLGDFEFNEQQYRQRLERTLDLFKKMRVQQQLDEAARRAEELARLEERMAERTEGLQSEQEKYDRPRPDSEEQGGQREGNEEPRDQREQGEREDAEDARSDDFENESEQSRSDAERQDTPEDQRGARSTEQQSQTAEDLAREQERARQEAESLLEKLRESSQQMQELRNMSMEQMQQLLEQAHSQQLPQQMQQNAEQLRQQQLQDAQKGQQQMSQQLQQMSSMIRQMQESMAGMSMNVNVAGIRQALEDVLTLSQKQEATRIGVQQLAPDSPMIREYAQEQVALGERLSTVADSLQRLSREIPQMSRTVQQFTGDALREMSDATTALADRSARTGAAHQQGAMMHLNELALVLADLLNQMMSGGAGGGAQSMQQMLQQLQQMAGQQEQLNQQIQDFLNDMQGNRLASDAEQRLQQMAQQQSAIRQQLRDLARNPEARGKVLGDLNRIADQMEESIQELRANHADRRTIERQQQILTRLLDAQKSLQDRGREERREGRSADDVFRESPALLPAMEEAEQLRRDLIRALEAGYAPEYQELIKRYFELLQQQSAPAPADPTRTN